MLPPIVRGRPHPGILPRTAFVIFVGLFVGPLAGTARAQEGALPQVGSVEGFVMSPRPHQPIESAQVAVEGGGPGISTDARGYFRLEGVPVGPRVLVARVLGRTTVRHTVVVSAGQVVRLDFELPDAVLPMPDVVVSANREAVRRAEVPANVGVVSAQDIQTTRPHHPAEIVGRVPGVHVVDLGGEGHTVAMRQPINYNPVYAYLEDGVPIRSTGFFNHNALYEVNIPEAERIEVFKGPATALYGSDAIGGVVNVLTRPPALAPRVELFAEGGRFGYGRILASASNTWREHGFRGDFNLTRFDGWRDRAEQDRQSGTLRHDWRLGGNGRLKTVIATSWIDSPGDGGSDVSIADFDGRSRVNYTPIAFRKVEAVRLSSSYERESGPWRLAVTGYGRHNRLELLPNWQLTYDPQVWDTKNRSLGVLGQLRRQFGEGSWVTAGFDLDHSPGRRVIDEILPDTDSTGQAFTSYSVGERQYDYDVTFRGVSPYVQGSVRLAQRLHLSGGLRFDHVGYRYENRLSVLETGPHRRPASTSVDYDHVSPNLGATWELTGESSVFASYRHGFRVPSEDQLFVQGSASNSIGLEPVRAESYETGVRVGWGRFGRAEASVYRMDIRDDILSFFNTTDFTSETSNAGRSRHWGVEAGLETRVRDVRLGASYGYNRHRYLEWVTETGLDYSGNEMESSPRHIGNLRATWEPSARPRTAVTVEWVHVGRYFTDPENLHTYDGYDLLHAYFTLPLVRTLDLVGRLNNAADVRYATTAAFNPFLPDDQSDRFGPGQPRTFFLGVQYSWEE